MSTFFKIWFIGWIFWGAAWFVDQPFNLILNLIALVIFISAMVVSVQRLR